MKTFASGGEFQQVPYSDGMLFNTRTKKTTHEQTFFKLGVKKPTAPNIRLICHDVFEGNNKREICISADMTWSDTLNALHESYGRPTIFEYQNQFHKMERVDDENKYLKFCILMENSVVNNQEPVKEVFVRFWDYKPAMITSPSEQRKNSMADSNDGRQPWSSGLMSCSGNFLELLQAFFCPCLPYGTISAGLGQGYWSSCLFRAVGCSPMTILLRQNFRSSQNITERNSHDIFVSCCCEACALVQMKHHMNERMVEESTGNDDEESATHAWKTSLCCLPQDFQTCSRCWTACCCSPCTFGRIRNVVLRGDGKKMNRTSCLLYCCCLCSPLLSFPFHGVIGGASRTQIRRDRSLPGSPCSDCLLHTFCCYCALYQEAVTVGLWPEGKKAKKAKKQKSKSNDRAGGEGEEEEDEAEQGEEGELKEEDGGKKDGEEAGGATENGGEEGGEVTEQKAEDSAIDPENITV